MDGPSSKNLDHAMSAAGLQKSENIQTKINSSDWGAAIRVADFQLVKILGWGKLRVFLKFSSFKQI